MNNEDLVSVVVVTYNSSKYVIETLDSIKNQTYRNLELIISDDCSLDNTVELCREWIDINAERFAWVKLITTDNNTGICGNLNRGILSSHGKWIKLFAGDDLLRENAIEKFQDYVSKNNYEVCISALELFNEYNDVSNTQIQEYQRYFEYAKLPYEDKLKELAKHCPWTGPGYFFSRKLYDEIGGFDEKYSMWEEYTFAYRVLTKGYQIYSLDEKLVLYRVRRDSASMGRGKVYMDPRMYTDCKNIFYDLQMPLLKKRYNYLMIWHLMIFWAKEGVKVKFRGNTRAKIICGVYSLFDPATYKRIIKKII